MCNSTIGFGSIKLSNTPVVLGIATASTFHCISSPALPFYSWSICRVSLCALRSIVFITLKHPSALVRATASTFHCATCLLPSNTSASLVTAKFHCVSNSFSYLSTLGRATASLCFAVHCVYDPPIHQRSQSSLPPPHFIVFPVVYYIFTF